ncbi:hypothetical protein [Ruegeria sp. AD91A]|uniref:hypothetical protein n=1 Tax=Ruegeria sp. AD91A TaxID=2293862 RepID=UPI0013C2E58F|nr:hypothetical protein [Ruegeria sp. AD91A]
MRGNASFSMSQGFVSTSLLELAGLGIFPWLFSEELRQGYTDTTCVVAPINIEASRVMARSKPGQRESSSRRNLSCSCCALADPGPPNDTWAGPPVSPEQNFPGHQQHRQIMQRRSIMQWQGSVVVESTISGATNLQSLYIFHSLNFVNTFQRHSHVGAAHQFD